jgi:hypothetical protein
MKMLSEKLLILTDKMPVVRKEKMSTSGQWLLNNSASAQNLLVALKKLLQKRLLQSLHAKLQLAKQLLLQRKKLLLKNSFI